METPTQWPIAADKIADQMIARRSRVGCNSAESARLLSELMDRHYGANLASALVYQGFATEHQAYRFARRLLAVRS